MIVILVISENDGVIFAQVFAKHMDKMMFTSVKYNGRNDAEDILQDVLVRIMEAYDGKAEKLEKLPGSFFTIVVKNYSINKLKKDTTEKRHMETKSAGNIDEFTDTKSLNPEKIITRAEIKQILERLLDTLPSEVRDMLILKFYNKVKNKELAAMFGLSETSVSTRISRAMLKLRASLQKEGIDIED